MLRGVGALLGRLSGRNERLLQGLISEREAAIVEREQTTRDREVEIARLQQLNNEKECAIRDRENVTKHRENHIDELHSEIVNIIQLRDSAIGERDQAINVRERQIAELHREIEEIAKEYENSLSTLEADNRELRRSEAKLLSMVRRPDTNKSDFALISGDTGPELWLSLKLSARLARRKP